MKTASDDPALHGLAAILLRDSCECAECRDSGNGQRLGSITDLPADVSVIETRTAGNSVTVIFGPDGHRAVLVTRPDLMLTFRLEPGDCVVFDNTRILHARTGFAATGQRHLQGCYADLDGAASTMAVLRRKRGETG